MAKTSTKIYVNSISFASLLTILFVWLKLTNQIQWSWIWVVCPMWFGFAAFAAVALAILAIFAVMICISSIKGD